MTEAVLYIAAGSLGTLLLLALYACCVAWRGGFDGNPSEGPEDDKRHRRQRWPSP